MHSCSYIDDFNYQARNPGLIAVAAVGVVAVTVLVAVVSVGARVVVPECLSRGPNADD